MPRDHAKDHVCVSCSEAVLVPNKSAHEPQTTGFPCDHQIPVGTEFGLMAVRIRGPRSAAASTAVPSEAENYSLTSMSDEDFDPIPDASTAVHGHDTLFSTGQHRGDI